MNEEQKLLVMRLLQENKPANMIVQAFNVHKKMYRLDDLY